MRLSWEKCEHAALYLKKLLPFITGRRLVISVPYAWVIIFALFPCIILLKISLSDSILASPPYTNICEWISEACTLNIKLNFSNYKDIFTDAIYIKGFISSIVIASLSTICCLFIGFPMAYAIARADKKIRGILLMLVVLPFWTSFLIRVYAWILLLSPTGIINNFLMYIGITDQPLALMNNTFAACVGIVYTYLPFMIIPLYGTLEKLDFSIVEAAYDLGCSPFRTLLSIIIPLSLPGIIAGSAMVFVPTIGEFVIPELLGGAQTLTIGRVMWNEFFSDLSWPTATALAVILILFMIIQYLVIQKVADGETSGGKRKKNGAF